MAGCSSIINPNSNNTNIKPNNFALDLEDDFFSKGTFIFDEEIIPIAENEIIDPMMADFSEKEINLSPSLLLENIEPNDFTNNKHVEYVSFDANASDSLKQQLKDFLEPTGYKLIWNTSYDVIFENNVNYESETLLDVLKLIAQDLSKMGIDIHMNVYLKNKVVLVYSVRS